MAQYTGRVAWFNNAKGFGFIKRDEGADVFVHYTAIERHGYKTLNEEDVVEFDVVQGSQGPQPSSVIVIKGRGDTPKNEVNIV